MATENVIKRALIAFPILVHLAKKRDIITYKELGSLIKLHHRVVPHILGYIRDEICIVNDLPLINAIVVNKKTKMAGRSFLPRGAGHLTKTKYRIKFEQFRDEAFYYKKWDQALKKIGLQPIKESQEDLDIIGKAHTEAIKRNGGNGENVGHLRLKRFVAKNPRSIGLSTNKKGIEEHLFISGDECDVVFDFGSKGAVVVEVKNGEKGELVKGIYQAIKYRALMKAERGKGKRYRVRAFIVAYDMPVAIIKKAKIFDIECCSISKIKVWK